MFRILFLICFLIIYSCDLPNEANKDCNGDEGGFSQLDDCGICDGNNEDKDCSGVCFGDAYEDICQVCDNISINDGIACSECDDSSITFSDEIGGLCDCDGNVIDSCGECGGEGYVDCLCESYIESNLEYDCSLEGSAPYQIGDYLSCETVQEEFDLCYPEDCDKTVKLADFEGKNILIVYEFDTWSQCYNTIPQLEEMIISEYIDHPDLAIINVINDNPYAPPSCQEWGQGGDDRLPLIIDEATSAQYIGGPGIFNDWFCGSGNWSNIACGSSPWYIIIDSNFKYIDLLASKSEALTKLEELLD